MQGVWLDLQINRVANWSSQLQTTPCLQHFWVGSAPTDAPAPSHRVAEQTFSSEYTPPHRSGVRLLPSLLLCSWFLYLLVGWIDQVNLRLTRLLCIDCDADYVCCTVYLKNIGLPLVCLEQWIRCLGRVYGVSQHLLSLWCLNGCCDMNIHDVILLVNGHLSLHRASVSRPYTLTEARLILIFQCHSAMSPLKSRSRVVEIVKPLNPHGFLPRQEVNITMSGARKQKCYIGCDPIPSKGWYSLRVAPKIALCFFILMTLWHCFHIHI